MANAEDIEKVRQEIMRFRELLNIMRKELENGERTYAKLFSSFTPEEMAGTKEKDLQWKLAEKMIDDLSPLRRSVGNVRFHTRELDRAFAELYDIIVTVQDPE
jgi:hypothetical protein